MKESTEPLPHIERHGLTIETTEEACSPAKVPEQEQSLKLFQKTQRHWFYLLCWNLVDDTHHVHLALVAWCGITKSTVRSETLISETQDLGAGGKGLERTWDGSNELEEHKMNEMS